MDMGARPSRAEAQFAEEKSGFVFDPAVLKSLCHDFQTISPVLKNPRIRGAIRSQLAPRN